jgi:tight adherence protein C
MVNTLGDPQTWILGLIALAVFATVVTLVGPLLTQDRFAGRLKSVASQRERLRRQSREQLARDAQQKGGIRRRESQGLMKDIVERLNLRKLLEDPKLGEKLLQAGLRGQGPVTAFYFARFALPIVFGGGAALYLFFVKDFGQPPIMRMCMSVLALGVGYYLPAIWIKNLGQKRRDSIMAAFPDALDLLLICVESGMSIEAAFQKVATEIGANSIELAEELHLTMAELAYLQERRQAYENLARRTNHAGVRSVAMALIQAERYGTPIASALRVMAKENRDLRISAAEKKAAALPAKLTVPMILFFLPVLFVVILGPAFLRFQAM